VRILALALAAILLSACDPVKLLVVKSTPGTSVTIYSNQKILPAYYGNPDEKIVIKVPYTDSATRYERLFLYGLGTWPKDKIPAMSDNIDSIVLNTTKGKVLLKDKSEITDYLIKHRKGTMNHILTIEAK
jgi:hypothetical protein